MQNNPDTLVEKFNITDVGALDQFAELIEPILRQVFKEHGVYDVRCGITTDVLIKILEDFPGIKVQPVLGLYITPQNENTERILKAIYKISRLNTLGFEETYSSFTMLKLLLTVGELNTENALYSKLNSKNKIIIDKLYEELLPFGKEIFTTQIKATTHMLARVSIPSGTVFLDLNAIQFGSEKFDYVSIWRSDNELNENGIYIFEEGKRFDSAPIETIEEIANEIKVNLRSYFDKLNINSESNN